MSENGCITIYLYITYSCSYLYEYRLTRVRMMCARSPERQHNTSKQQHHTNALTQGSEYVVNTSLKQSTNRSIGYGYGYRLNIQLLISSNQ